MGTYTFLHGMIALSVGICKVNFMIGSLDILGGVMGTKFEFSRNFTWQKIANEIGKRLFRRSLVSGPWDHERIKHSIIK